MIVSDENHGLLCFRFCEKQRQIFPCIESMTRHSFRNASEKTETVPGYQLFTALRWDLLWLYVKMNRLVKMYLVLLGRWSVNSTANPEWVEIQSSNLRNMERWQMWLHCLFCSSNRLIGVNGMNEKGNDGELGYNWFFGCWRRSIACIFMALKRIWKNESFEACCEHIREREAVSKTSNKYMFCGYLVYGFENFSDAVPYQTSWGLSELWNRRTWLRRVRTENKVL